jgi:membrane fusion protein (multidrug efflux system)
VAVVLSEKRRVLAIPATSVNFAPFGDSVFLIEQTEAADRSAPLVLRQQFVQLGERRGDYVQVRSGLAPGQRVVSTGVFKLRSGQTVVVDNSKSPSFDVKPTPENA